MIPRFFIDRPIFAAVLSIVVTLAGALAVFTLPLSQYPQVTPPTIQIDCNYPGANAQVVSQTIASPIEQQVNGVEDMLYMTSQCTSDGSYTCTITFKVGTNLNMAQVRVQNRVNLATPALPDVVRATGVTTRKRSPELMLTVSLNSPNQRFSQLYLSNYAVLQLREELQRIPGIADVTVFGQRDYAMRIWVNPEKLAARGMTAADVVNALRQENAQIAAGHIAQPPVESGQPIQFTLSALGRLITPEDFEQVVVKVGDRGQVVKIRDIARVELGAKAQDVANRFDNKETIGLAIFLLSDANALDVAETIKSKMERLSKDFPDGMRYEIGYDTTPFIRESIKEVFKSLRDSIILVGIVVLLFLQSWRAGMIPLAAVPVAIIGTFAAMALGGYTLNNLTLFGLVLAVGIVVDDAIVVVEAVQHNIDEGHAPREATVRAMDSVAGPIIGVGAVLSAVFIPCAFLPGIVGSFFKQFALTITVSTLISTFNSLTLSPALCAILLKPKDARPDLVTRVLNFLFGWLFWVFNRGFKVSGRAYVRVVGWLLRVPLLVFVGYAGIVSAGAWGYQQMPTGFIPQQDKGYLICSVQLPDATSADRTREVINRITALALQTEGVAHVNSIAGNSFILSAYGSNFGSMFIILDGFEKRQSAELYSEQVMAKLRRKFAAAVPEGVVTVLGAPAVSGLGRAGGFRIMLEDRGDVGPDALQGQTNNFIEKANQQKQVVGLMTVFKTDSPQVFLKVDREACLARGVELTDVYAQLQATMGSRYVNDFNAFGRTWQVNVQADLTFRNELEDIKKLKVRNHLGVMVPLAAVLKVENRSAPLVVSRYNMYPAAAVNGTAAPGVSSGDAIAMMERLAEQELPAGRMGYEWTELTFIEKQSRNTGVQVFALSVAFVFLVLAALYESWAFPFAVILVVPVCVSFSVAAVWLTNPDVTASVLARYGYGPAIQDWAWKIHPDLEALGIRKQDINIFTQVGFVVLIGLACKNAILIVEFAKVARAQGADLRTAILDACKLRFRPIIMTSTAFILGVIPLAIARGAGAEMRQALGVAVLGGMVGVTVFGIFLTPVFFSVVSHITDAATRSAWLGRFGGRAMYVLRLRFVRPVAGAVAKRVRRPRPTGS